MEHIKVVGTPHLGASTVEAQLKVAQEIAQQFVAAVKGQGLGGVVCGCGYLCFSLSLQSYISIVDIWNCLQVNYVLTIGIVSKSIVCVASHEMQNHTPGLKFREGFICIKWILHTLVNFGKGGGGGGGQATVTN